MPQLPATILEAEALAYARDAIARQREPGGIYGPDAEENYGRRFMKRWALFSTFACDEIVYFAEKGSVEADLALREIIAERTDRNEPLTAVLRAYNIRLINPSRSPKTPGPTRAGNFMRDMGIVCLVTALIERFGLKPARNSASRRSGSSRPSACSIAAQALSEAKLGMWFEEKAVEHIWRRYLPIFAGTNYAAGSRFASLNFVSSGKGIFG